MVTMKRIVIAPIFLIILLVVLLSCERNTKSEKKAEASIKAEARVIDSADLLSGKQERNLFKMIREIEDKNGPQIAIVIIDSLYGKKIEDFSLLKVVQLNLGRDQFKDGLLIAIAYKDRKIRIEVGLGLEKIVTNEIAGQIIKEEIAPQFKEQKYYEGIRNAVVKIKTLIEENKDLIGQSP